MILVATILDSRDLGINLRREKQVLSAWKSARNLSYMDHWALNGENLKVIHKQATGSQTISELLITSRHVMNRLGFKKYFQYICSKTKNSFKNSACAKKKNDGIKKDMQ